MTESEAINVNPLTLAYIGDAVFSLRVREELLSRGAATAGVLHKSTSQIVNAGAQSELLGKIAGDLTSQEADLVRRARNVHTQNHAKNASVIEYHRATALEALIGFLYLTKQNERLDFIMKFAFPDN